MSRNTGRMPNLCKTAARVILLLAHAALVPGAERTPAHSPHGMVVSPESNATRIGVEVLEQGGTAADATVAVALALAVTNPQAGNLGGGGFLLYRDEAGNHFALDFRETAPAALTAERFLDETGTPVPGASLVTGLAVGVPGSVAGLAEIHRRWGALPWPRLVAPAVELARGGFAVYPELERAFDDAAERLRLSPEARRVFFPTGALPRTGERLVQPDLAASLERIAERGRNGFYRGPIAKAVARTVRERGGVLTRRDLARYRIVDREPVRGRYRGHEVVSFPPPSSGGVVLLQMLALLEMHDVPSGAAPGQALHVMAEIQRRAFADRARWLGDPDHHDVPTARLLAPDYLAARAATIDPGRASPSSEILPGDPLPDRHDTLHFSVADREGRAAGMTTTLNTQFGSGIVARGTGILLNNEIDDFSLAPGVPNTYGLVGGEANAVRPRKRPLSSMTPTIVEYAQARDRPLLVLGSPGGGRIINAVLQVLVNVIDHRMPLQAAVDAPRIHHQWLPDRIDHEPGALTPDVRHELERRGHALAIREQIGNVNAIGTDEHGDWIGAADRRRGGTAAGPR